MKTIREIIDSAASYLEKLGFERSRREAEELLSDALGMSRMDLYLIFDKPLEECELELCRERLKRRGKGEPLAYIHGEVEFFGCQLKVNRSVLIPRPETEQLVDKIVTNLMHLNTAEHVLWDLCCGSGCIGIALKKRFPQLHVILSDISCAALAVAEENAHANGVEIELREGDLFTPFNNERCHFFTCNPPYVSEVEFPHLQKEVRDYEPRSALVGGCDGLSIYRRLAETLPQHLHQGGKAWLEIGACQADPVKTLFAQGFWKTMCTDRDWSGRNRFFFLETE